MLGGPWEAPNPEKVQTENGLGNPPPGPRKAQGPGIPGGPRGPGGPEP